MNYDVTIIGAGPSGMIAMLRFAEAGMTVLGIERSTAAPLAPMDLRSTAFLMPSVAILQESGVWDALVPHAVALDVMEIIDAAQIPTKSVAFHADEIGQEHFGFNIANAQLHATLRAAVDHNPNITMTYGAKISAMRQFSSYVEFHLSNGETQKTHLLVGADGRNSVLREKLGITVKQHEYDQWAQVFAVTHEHPHNNISTEVHDQGGPFTTVPAHDINGRPASAIVWMDTSAKFEARRDLDAVTMTKLINERSANVRGEMRLETAVGAFPMTNMHASSVHDHRAVLIGEAAHVVPPIGAQGLNMSLRDIASLVRACETGALQNPSQLTAWARNRRADVGIRRKGIGLLNQISIGDFSRATSLRSLGLWALEKETPIRRGLMRLGLGA